MSYTNNTEYCTESKEFKELSDKIADIINYFDEKDLTELDIQYVKAKKILCKQEILLMETYNAVRKRIMSEE